MLHRHKRPPRDLGEPLTVTAREYSAALDVLIRRLCGAARTEAPCELSADEVKLAITALAMLTVITEGG